MYYKYKFRWNRYNNSTNIRMNRLKRSWHPCLTILIISRVMWHMFSLIYIKFYNSSLRRNSRVGQPSH